LFPSIREVVTMSQEPEEAEVKARREERLGQVSGDRTLEKQAVAKEVKARIRKGDRRARASKRKRR
jgi:hypothetical protein